MILMLKDGTEIKVLDESTLFNIQSECTTIEEVDVITQSLKEKGNLDFFSFKADNGDVYATYENFAYIDTSYIEENGIYHVTFSIRKKTDTEIRLDALESEQELQNGAIDELASIVGGE